MDYNYNYSYNVDGAGTGLAIFAGVWLLFWLVIALVMTVAMWKIFTKAGRKGWEAIIPIYNIYVLCQIVGRPGWWLLLFFIPFVNLAVSIVLAIDLAKSFGKDAVFGVVALWLFSIIGYLMLGFGKDKYVGPSVKPSAPKPAA